MDNNNFNENQNSQNSQNSPNNQFNQNGQNGQSGYFMYGSQQPSNQVYQTGNTDYSQQDRGYHKKKPKKKFSWKKGAAVAACIVLFGGVVGGSFAGVRYVAGRLLGDTVTIAKTEHGKLNVDKSSELATVTTSESSEVSENDVSKVVKNVMPAIVSINNTYTETDDYGYFFGGSYEQEVEGSGSGIIIGQNNSEVLIATNNHVVAGDNAKIKVTFYDDSQVDATIKGTDSANDLAVVAVKISSLSDETKQKIKIATLGDSDKLEVGEMCIAIGNALGYGQSVTVGYISAKDREISIDDCTLTLLQTDAAINPGNSGGALLNEKGEVIGINSAKFSSTEVEGMGYAIPISDAIPIINDLMNREQLAENEQAYLGVKGRDINDTYSAQFNMPKGIFINEISSGSPADKGGLKSGDIITEIDGKKMTGMKDLESFLSYNQAGTKVTVTVQRLSNGSYQEKKITVTLGSREDVDSSSSDSENSQNSGRQQSPDSPYSYGDDYDDYYDDYESNDPYGWFFPQQ
ncbi:MAG: trypsin-like peptidase domain-containing protein [Clostridiales bacterium]|nr:trypsin-like peptidase domain-containing protein [Clostridiales bacterium]